MKITVDQERCCGAGQCVIVAPEVVDQRDEAGIVELLDPAPPAEQQAAVEEAAAVCPTAAIALVAEE